MLRGGAFAPAARLFLVLVAAGSRSPAAGAQVPQRTRDVGVATVSYDNGRTFTALTLNETAVIERSTGSLVANGLLSLFDDGRWSMQGLLAGSRFSAPMAPGGIFRRWFSDLRGELALNSSATAQQGFMPTLQVNGEVRLHLTARDHAVRGGAALARTFDGVGWRSTVIGEAGGWWRVKPGTVLHATTRPMQLQFGDLLGDTEGGVSWVRGRSEYDVSLGVRLGEADKATSGWGTFTATWPLRAGLYGTASIGSYPVDLIQGLPGGRYVALALRLPGGRFPSLRSSPPPRIVPIAPERPELPTTEPLTLVIGPALDSLEIREIRVWAPGVREVELLADFVDWIPVPLVRQPNGEWRGYYYVRAGLHRLNLRLDRREMAVPRNLATVRDDFSGTVGVVVVK
ncbi:MAG: hypothetical protein IT361_04110 [Gemmatimonadaceae bacterium]|nr:hypothetical protein [Gemmatimonadaceae bacterium]